MITEEQLRKIAEAEGCSPEEIDEICARHSQIQQALAEAAREWCEMWERVALSLQTAEDIFTQLAEMGTTPPPPKKETPRPPRYAGPVNKGRPWTRQPPRVARSCCRKMRR